VLKGLEEGATVVSGPFKTISELVDRSRIKIQKERTRR